MTDLYIANEIIASLDRRNYLSDMLKNGIPNTSINGNDVKRVWDKIIKSAVDSVK